MGSGRQRISLIDGVRGIAVVLMVAHHFLYDLVNVLGAPGWIFENPVFQVLQYIFSSLFILISGISSEFSRSNVKRGLKVLVIALALTLVTTLMQMPIRFGILHLLSVCMIFYGLTRTLWDRLPRRLMILIYIILFAASVLARNLIHTENPYIWMFGFYNSDFVSYDYYPILPWLFMFMIGTVLGAYIIEGKLPARFYTTKVPIFPAVGRHALLIYILHQPVLFGLTLLIRIIFM